MLQRLQKKKTCLLIVLSILAIQIIGITTAAQHRSSTIISSGFIEYTSPHPSDPTPTPIPTPEPALTLTVAKDGTGDYTDIQTAINAAPTTQTTQILIKTGLYDLNPQLRYPYKSIIVKSNIILKGEGIDQTIIRSFPTKQPAGSAIRAPTILSQTNIQNLHIQDLTIIQNGSPDNQGWNAIDLRGGTNTHITIQNIKIRDVTGAGISVPRFSDLMINNVDVQTAWTGIAIGGGSECTVQNSRIVNTEGDGIFPQGYQPTASRITDLRIIDNYINNAGDTGLDITSPRNLLPHERILLEGNTIIDTHIRVSNSYYVTIRDNTITDGSVCADCGQARPGNITVEGNRIVTN